MPPKKTTRTAAKKTTAAASSAAKKAPAKPRAKASKTAAAALSSKKAAAADFTIAGHKFLLSPPFLGLKRTENLKAAIKLCGGSVTTSSTLAQFVVTQTDTGAHSAAGEVAVQAGAVRVSLEDFYKAVGRWGKDTGIRPPDFTGDTGELTEKELQFLGSGSLTDKYTADNTKVILVAAGFRVLHSDAPQPPVTIVLLPKPKVGCANTFATNDYTQLLGDQITNHS